MTYGSPCWYNVYNNLITYDFSVNANYVFYLINKKRVSELRGPALVCLSASDKKLAWYFVNIAVLVFLMGQNPECPGYNYWKYWFSSCAGIQNVQDIIIEITNTRQVYIQRVGLFLPPPLLIKSVYASIRCTWYKYTKKQTGIGLPTQYRFNVGPASQPIAGSMLVNHFQRWPNNETELGGCPVFTLTAIRVRFYPPKGHYSDNTIHWPNCEIMLGHHLRRLANIIPTKTP